MNEITNHAELTVVKKKEGKHLVMWLLNNAISVFVPLAVFIITAVIEETGGPALTALGIFFIPIWCFLYPKLIRPLTVIYVDIEEKMDISGGTLTLSRIMGRRKKKDYIAVKAADLEAVKPYRDDYRKEADEYKADIRIQCVSTMKHKDVYFAYYTNEAGKKVLMFFEMTEKAISVMKFLNSKTVVAEVSR